MVVCVADMQNSFYSSKIQVQCRYYPNRLTLVESYEARLKRYTRTCNFFIDSEMTQELVDIYEHLMTRRQLNVTTYGILVTLTEL